MRNGVVVLAGTMLLMITACGGDGTSGTDEAAAASTLSPTTSASPTTAAPPEASEAIPDGTYSRVVIGEEAVAAGFDPEVVETVIGADGELPIVLKVAGDRWSLFVTNDSGIAELGDLGTASYDGDGRWVIVSESVGAPGVVEVLDWTMSDGMLSLAYAPVEGHIVGDPGLIIMEGSFEQGP